MRVAFCGTGLLGTPMVARLVAAGHEVSVWNRSPEKVRPLVALGAKSHSTPAEAAADSEVVCLCLLDADAVEQVVFGFAGVARAPEPRLLIDHSSIAPHLTREFAVALAKATGADWLDAPVSGGVAGAKSGTLTVMVGGGLEPLRKARGVMSAYGSRITHMGGIGAGQTAKLCNQAIVASTLVAIAEAIALARNCGMDPTRLPEGLEGGWADSKLFRMFVPRMTAPPSDIIGALNTMLKDVESIEEAAHRSLTPIPVTASSLQTLRLASSLGLGTSDLSAVARLFERRAV